MTLNTSILVALLLSTVLTASEQAAAIVIMSPTTTIMQPKPGEPVKGGECGKEKCEAYR